MGSFWVAGKPAQGEVLSVGGTGKVAGDVHVGGAMTTHGMFNVGGDLHSAGSIRSSGLVVAGKLYLPAGQRADGITAAKGNVVGPVSVAEPCDCKSPLDVAAVVKAGSGRNDNGIAGVSAAALDRWSGLKTTPSGVRI